MPIPKPKSGENRDTFIGRCMGNDTMNNEYPDQDQRMAVCSTQWRNRNNNNMETTESMFLTYQLTANNYQMRVEMHQGKEHLVVPVVMMVEGVHSGSAGALFHSAEELGRYPGSWNGIPVTIQHPQRNGGYVSANDPQTIETCVGRVYNTYMDGDKLKAEAWLDIEKLNNISPQALTYIRHGRPLDVSVGVFNDEEMVEGDWNGEHYQSIARNHRPDHLALLPGGQGACSWSDGCGVRANENEEGGKMKNDVEVFKKLQKQGLVVIPITNAAGYREVMQKLQSKLDAMDTDTRIHFLEELYEDSFVYRVQSRDDTTALYKRTYEVSDNDNIEITGEPVEVRRKVDYVTYEMRRKNNNEETNVNENKNKGGKTMACCEDKVDRLIANKATRFTANDKEWLMKQDESTLDKFNPVEVNEDPKKPKVNKEQALEVLQLNSQEDYLNLMPDEMKNQVEAGLKLHEDYREKLVKKITDNSAKDTWADGELTAMSVEMLEKIAKSIKPTTDYSGQGGAAEVSDNSEQEFEPMPMAGYSFDNNNK